ncbi:MAG: glycine--tRNA ligase subunit beta [Rickettsiales bacterium]|jgi:glycyl-tRNA synthetase beta chain|nr:glycine--tRNA ligase subunit beta [Rickettsiales bacterium]
MSTTELLLELFSEEIPARMQIKAAQQILQTLEKEIKDLGLSYSNAKYFVTPRRVTLHIDGVPKELPERVIERKGPKPDAKAEAIAGFLKSVGLRLEDLSVKDGFYYAKKIESAKPADSSLQAAIEQMLISFTWPKSMRIGEGRNRWVRPLRNILCLFSGKVLPVEFAHLTANNHCFAHRFMAADKTFEVNSFTEYQNIMRENFVVLSSNKRREIIISEAERLAKNISLKVALDENLLNEVVGLVEYPNVLLGKMEKQFTELPKEVLVSAMKTHQRYFYLEDKNGKIAPYFIFVANVKHESDDLIIRGNEKVLKARLADAQFFWEQDLKHPSSQNLAKLAKMTFHSKLGSMFDKTNRIIELAEFIATRLQLSDLESVKKVALLAKTDLVSEMVGEFPELQGIMGKYYAKASGESEEISTAIAEHYRPVDTNDIGDTSYLAAIIAIADKLDTITGMWLVGEKPTSSKDPFALRRAALGIIKLIRYHKMNLSLSELINKTIELYKLKSDNAQQTEIVLFFHDRLKYYLKAKNFRHDLIMASIGEDSDNICSAITKLTNLQQFINSPKSQELIFAIKRILNIISNAKIDITLEVNEDLLAAPELKLYKSFKEIGKVSKAEDLVSLVPDIDLFFEEVMVNDQDLKLKQNRLNLLNNIGQLSYKIADFSKIDG